VLLGTALCLLAATFGSPALYVPGVALIMLAGAAEASVRLGSRQAHLVREPVRATVEEGAPLQLIVRVVGGRIPFRGGEVAGWPGASFILRRWLADGCLEFGVRLERRGAHVIGPSILRFQDPFGICARSLLSAQTDVLVLPRIESVARADLKRVVASTRDTSRRSSGRSASELDTLGPYRQGIPASRIHWPTVARTGTLVERRLQTERDRLPLIVLDTRRPAGVEALDMLVRAAASLSMGLAQLGGCSILLPGKHRAYRLDQDLRSWPALHMRLALLEAGGAPARPAIERAAIVLWLTASTSMQTQLGRRGSEADYVISPFPRGGSAVLFEVAGCSVQPAGRRARARAA